MTLKKYEYPVVGNGTLENLPLRNAEIKRTKQVKQREVAFAEEGTSYKEIKINTNRNKMPKLIS